MVTLKSLDDNKESKCIFTFLSKHILNVILGPMTTSLDGVRQFCLMDGGAKIEKAALFD